MRGLPSTKNIHTEEKSRIRSFILADNYLMNIIIFLMAI